MPIRAAVTSEGSNLTTVEQRVSVWSFELGPLRFSRQRAVRRMIGTVPDRPRDARRFFSAPKMVGSAAAGALAVSVPLYFAHAETGTALPYVVSQAIPSLGTSAAPRHAPARKSHAHSLAAARTVAAADRSLADADGPVSGLTVGQAVQAAWSSGEAQEWTENGAHGIVVPSVAQQSDGLTCRSFSRLTRHDAGPDSVEQWRKCVGSGSGD